MWWFLAFLSGAGLAGRNIFFKLSNNHIDPSLAAMVLSLSMAAVAVLYFLFNRLTRGAEPILMTGQGIYYSLIAGISLGAANILLAYAYKTGGLASLTGILQNGIALSLTVLLGILLLKENVSIGQYGGIALACLGILLIVKG
jgi:uncharacterized membrane protein